jgi:6,7-dimethyl-8-ribityllumazine synthase
MVLRGNGYNALFFAAHCPMAKYDLQSQDYSIDGARFAIVASRFNASITSALLEGAAATLAEHGVPEDRLSIVQVPGAFEIPLTAKRLAASGRFEAIIALGAVVRGDTPHFEYVAGECARGIARVAIEENIPVIFGVLTTDTEAQARDRIGGREGNKGSEAAMAALEMVTVLRRLEG